jgi:hypothetical protein
MKRRTSLLVLALALAAAPAARANDEDEAASTELFNAGRDLMKRGDYAAACPKLADSARLKPTVGALAKLAECEEHESRLVSAYTRWKQALNLARATADERIGDVEREIARLDRVVAKIRVVAGGALPPEVVIRVDDVAMSTAGLGLPLPVELGHHTVQAVAPQAKPWSAQVEVTEPGATMSIAVPALERAEEAGFGAGAPKDKPESAAAPAADHPPVADEPPPVATSVPLPAPPAAVAARSSAWRTAGIAAAGAGLGVMTVGAAFGIDALRRRDDAHCAGTVCPDTAAAAGLASAKTSADWSTGLLVAGGAFVAAGFAVWLFARDTRATVRVGAVALPGGAALVGAWH